MIDLAMIWRRDDPRQPALEAIKEGAKHYRTKFGRTPNFVNVPPGFLTDSEITRLREHWTVDINAPAYFQNDVWLGVMTPAIPKHSRAETGTIAEGRNS